MASGEALKYWFNGLPYGNLGGSADPGGFKYWFNGVPFVTQPSEAGFPLNPEGWDSSRDYGGDVTFTDADRTATVDSGSGGIVYSVTKHNSGRQFAEATFSGTAIGLYDEVSENGIELTASGAVYVYGDINTETYGVFPPLVVGDTVGIAADIDTGTVWFRVNGGPWNNDPAQGPD